MNYKDALKKAEKALLEGEGISASFDSRELLSFVTGKSKTKISFSLSDELKKDQEERFFSLVEKRKSGYPLQYILGSWEFYGIELKVGEGVLIPRADTETLVDCVLSLPIFKEKEEISLLDLFSGSGAIAIAISENIRLKTAHAVELSKEAFSFLEENSKGTRVEPILADALSFVPKEPYDIITANPPYISFSERKELSREIDFEPEMALTAKDQGLFFYKEISKRYFSFLNRGGYLIFEIGAKQKTAVKQILVQNGYKEIFSLKDLGGNPRVVGGRKL